MTTALVITAINCGDATTIDGIKLRLFVATGIDIEIPDLQNILDGLLFVGTVKRSFAPTKNAMVYELTEQRKWEPEGTVEIVSILTKRPEIKLDWNKAIVDGPKAISEKQFEQLENYKSQNQELRVISNPYHENDIFRYSSFQVTPQNKPKPEPKKGLDLEKEVLAVIEHDGPSAIKIFQRIKIRLHLQDSELNFYDVRTALDELKAKRLVGYVKATETTNGGWVQLRIPKAMQK